MSENVREFTSKQIKYAHWKANPYRNETKKEFATQLNITDKTLERWDKLEGFKEFVDELIEEYTDGVESDIWKALIDNAKKEDGNADRRLFFQLKNKLIERKEVKSEIKTALVEFIGGDINDGDSEGKDEDTISK